MGLPLNINNITLEIDGVQSILVSSIQPDTNSDYYVRILTLYNDPSGVLNRQPAMILKLYGGSQATNDQSELEIQTPQLEF